MLSKSRYVLLGLLLVMVLGCNISGTITQDGTGVAGVTVMLNGDDTETVVTDSRGRYTFSNLRPGEYEVSPMVPGYVFSPEEASVTLTRQPVSGIDFEVVSVSSIENSFGMVFTSILAGDFMMGSPKDEIGRSSDEIQHHVTLTEPFCMQITEVTQDQWAAVVIKAEEMGVLNPGELEKDPSYFKDCGGDCPVEYISWHDAHIFIDALNQLGEGTYKLPSEAQWEYAARAGSTTSLPNGDLTEEWCDFDPLLDEIGWYCYNSDNRTHPVKQKEANAWGLFDMHGNVREWCEDWYGIYAIFPVVDPEGPGIGTLRINRGGGWAYNAKYARSANRIGYVPDTKHYFIGLRLVMVP